jgi:DNA helicase-2/ATP-dependent DNA helicase PcrA
LRQVIKNSKEVDFLPSDFVVADDFDERHIIMEDIKRMLGDLKIKDVKELFNRLSANWENLTADRQDWVQSFANPRFIGAWQQHRKVYGYALRAELVYQFKKVLEQLEEPKLDGPINYLIPKLSDSVYAGAAARIS